MVINAFGVTINRNRPIFLKLGAIPISVSELRVFNAGNAAFKAKRLSYEAGDDVGLIVITQTKKHIRLLRTHFPKNGRLAAIAVQKTTVKFFGKLINSCTVLFYNHNFVAPLDKKFSRFHRYLSGSNKHSSHDTFDLLPNQVPGLNITTQATISSLPISMSRQSIPFRSAGSFELVTPAESPTVPVADTTSKSESSGSYPIATNGSHDSTTTAMKSKIKSMAS